MAIKSFSFRRLDKTIIYSKTNTIEICQHELHTFHYVTDVTSPLVMTSTSSGGVV